MHHPSVSDGYDSPKQNVINDEFGQTGNLVFKYPNLKVELQRFKQDCRKKALDWAMAHFNGDNDHTLKVADKYYNWLISIPASPIKDANRPIIEFSDGRWFYKDEIMAFMKKNHESK